MSLTTRISFRRLLGARRFYATETVAVEPPPAGGHLPSVATSSLLRTTRDLAVRTPGIVWADEDTSGPSRAIVGGRDTRKMNMYQAVRDAMRYNLDWR